MSADIIARLHAVIAEQSLQVTALATTYKNTQRELREQEKRLVHVTNWIAAGKQYAGEPIEPKIAREKAALPRIMAEILRSASWCDVAHHLIADIEAGQLGERAVDAAKHMLENYAKQHTEREVSP